MEYRLASCPFCKKPAKFHLISHGRGGNTAGFDFDIKCTNCGVSTPKTYSLLLELRDNGDLVVIEDGRERAMKDWNGDRSVE